MINGGVEPEKCLWSSARFSLSKQTVYNLCSSVVICQAAQSAPGAALQRKWGQQHIELQEYSLIQFQVYYYLRVMG